MNISLYISTRLQSIIFLIIRGVHILCYFSVYLFHRVAIYAYICKTVLLTLFIKLSLWRPSIHHNNNSQSTNFSFWAHHKVLRHFYQNYNLVQKTANLDSPWSVQLSAAGTANQSSNYSGCESWCDLFRCRCRWLVFAFVWSTESAPVAQHIYKVAWAFYLSLLPSIWES